MMYEPAYYSKRLFTVCCYRRILIVTGLCWVDDVHYSSGLLLRHLYMYLQVWSMSSWLYVPTVFSVVVLYGWIHGTTIWGNHLWLWWFRRGAMLSKTSFTLESKSNSRSLTLLPFVKEDSNFPSWYATISTEMCVNGHASRAFFGPGWWAGVEFALNNIVMWYA